jgi:predicted transcriptional regulator
MKDLSAMRKVIKKNIDKADDRTVEIIFKILDDNDDLLENRSLEQEASLQRGLADARNGRLTPHDEVMKKLQKWPTK